MLHYRALIVGLDPQYGKHLPTKHTLLNKLVPRVYNELRSDVQADLLQSKSTPSALAVDLWTSDR